MSRTITVQRGDFQVSFDVCDRLASQILEDDAISYKASRENVLPELPIKPPVAHPETFQEWLKAVKG